MSKICNRCNILKESSEFYKNSHASDNLKSICKKCTSIKVKEYYDLHADDIKKFSKEYHLKNKKERNQKSRENFHKNPEIRKKNRLKPYNITQDQFDNLLDKSEYKCNICSLSQEEHYKLYKKDLFIDHNHENGRIRGILCRKCNLGIANFKDDIHLLNSAIGYLSKAHQVEICQ